jgi:hypothetical protein
MTTADDTQGTSGDSAAGAGDLGRCERITDGRFARCPDPATVETEEGDRLCAPHAAEEEDQD